MKNKKMRVAGIGILASMTGLVTAASMVLTAPADAAKTFVTRFSVSRLDQGLVDNIIGASLIPQCAMKVARSVDIGDYTPQSGFQCGCYFDFKTTGKTDCKPCQMPSDCPEMAKRVGANAKVCESHCAYGQQIDVQPDAPVAAIAPQPALTIGVVSLIVRRSLDPIFLRARITAPPVSLLFSRFLI